jgi:hypothetical protein
LEFDSPLLGGSSPNNSLDNLLGLLDSGSGRIGLIFLKFFLFFFVLFLDFFWCFEINEGNWFSLNLGNNDGVITLFPHSNVDVRVFIDSDDNIIVSSNGTFNSFESEWFELGEIECSLHLEEE